MTATSATAWQKEFGIEKRKPPAFFSSNADLGLAVPQAHVLRRAFDLMELDGVLCADNSPLVYFKTVGRINLAEVARLHQRFWNHGGAPILVLVAPDQVHVYSGMSRPVADADASGRLPSLVTVIERVEKSLREFVTSVESGDFFRQHMKSFNPAHRVDRDLLDNLKDTRDKLDGGTLRDGIAHVLDALLCRLVFTCYLFDRDVIGSGYLDMLGLKGAGHLRDVLALQPRASAKKALYRLFRQLGKDFNGDLFSDDLAAESESIAAHHIDTLDQFFRATIVRSGQQSFWPYDFGVIPIETISAIYEQFLKSSDEQKGAFYTPRFLAEVVLDTALEGFSSLLGKRYLDPACGSGIFLVGLFNRMAEEWKQSNPTARNDRRARELKQLLQDSLFGVDINPTACRITAFSLCLAYLDQLSPRDIQELQEKGQVLPRLIAPISPSASIGGEGNIWCSDFFSKDAPYPTEVNLVVGNPPWGSTATDKTPAGRWCAAHEKPLPDKQIAAAFVWKAVEQVATEGRVCFVLPHGVLFNHSTTALAYQKMWFRQHAVDRVLNLADFQRFLFDKAGHPAVVVSYRKTPPEDARRQVEYWAPKADWTVTQAEVITIAPQDRTALTVGDILQDLEEPDAPQIWKQRYWATPRDWRLLDRLSLYPRLRDHVRGPRDKKSRKPWVMAVGFQPVGENDDPTKAETIRLPSKWFVAASNPALDLFLLTTDCTKFDAAEVTVRSGSNKSTEVFRAPHVLLAKGFTSTAFADFPVSFQDAVRGIHGPAQDRNLLIFLAAYLRTRLARYFLFHTSSNWGVSRQEVHVEELLRLPMPLPDQQPDPRRCWEIVNEIARIVTTVAEKSKGLCVDRAGLVRTASGTVEALVEEYFDVLPLEKALIEDTVKVIIPSVRPTRKRPLVPTIAPSTPAQRIAYKDRVCSTLNGWAKRGQFVVHGHEAAAESLGVGMVTLEKLHRGDTGTLRAENMADLLSVLDRLRKVVARKSASIDVARGVMLFDRNRLHIVKPLGQRNWTQTAALNDADEIAGTILMQSPKVEI